MELTMPPIIGAAIRFITSAPVLVVHMIGNSRPMIAANRHHLRKDPWDRAFEDRLA